MAKLRIRVLIPAALLVGAAVYLLSSGESVIRNDSVDFDLENLFVDLEDRALAIERALFRSDVEALRSELPEDAAWQVPAPVSRSVAAPIEGFEKRTLGSDSVAGHRGRDAVVAAWEEYLSGYQVVADLRFKLKGFVEDRAWDRRAEVLIALEVRGVLLTGETVQDEVKYDGVLVREDEVWAVRDLTAHERSVRLASKRVFTQVTKDAGMEMYTADQLNVEGPFIVWDSRSPGNSTNLDYGGIASADVDGDGRLDVYVANAHGANNLFLNRGNGRFEDVTDTAGVAASIGSRGAAFADVDNDGDQDLFVTVGTFHVEHAQPSFNQLFRNEGGARFTDVTELSGLEPASESFTPTFFDYDLDGDLDLYIARYGSKGPRGASSYFEARNGEPNVLYRNLGDCVFEEVPGAAGAADTGWSYAVAVCDYDNDNWPDLYVANDYGSNRLYRNNGAGGFVEVQDAAGVTDYGNGMGAAWTDIDHDGRFDLYVTNMSSSTGRRILGSGPIGTATQREAMLKFTEGNSFFRANAAGTFDSVGEELGVAQTGWAWHADFLDFDRDADEDLFVVNGYITGVTEKDY